MPTAERGSHIDSDRYVNMPPSMPAIISTNRTIYAAVAPFERVLFFFAS